MGAPGVLQRIPEYKDHALNEQLEQVNDWKEFDAADGRNAEAALLLGVQRADTKRNFAHFF